MVTDLELPDASGVALSLEILERYPDTKVIVMSGSAELAGTRDLFIKEGLTVPFLHKPFSLLAFIDLVGALGEEGAHTSSCLAPARDEVCAQGL